MSFGRPANNLIKGSTLPPERGIFPLDHAGECKEVMQTYLNCLKAYRGDNSQCRLLGKEYLQCRMDKDLMLKDDFKNLGFQEEDSQKQSIPGTPSAPGGA
ncbi:Cytochrome c oxidase assembly protein cox19 [Saitoella coloradoensis]